MKLKVGDQYSEDFSFSQKDTELYAALTGDKNPFHLDKEFAKTTKFERPLLHGGLIVGFLSKLLGMDFPGPGTIIIREEFKFKKPVYPGDICKATLTISEIDEVKNRANILIYVENSDKNICLEGGAYVSNKTTF